HGFVCAKAKRQQHGFVCAKAKRQQHGFVCAKAKRQQHDVGHSGVFKGCEALSLSSSISADVFCTESVATGTDVWTSAEINKKVELHISNSTCHSIYDLSQSQSINRWDLSSIHPLILLQIIS
ncbi:hypothetical protein, partial [Lysinibacillus agricola]|uniref:hypothetical protein n=1 Tax=Lysinibacillus agricola TaxID=2590012 RepID=UPI003C1CFDC0